MADARNVIESAQAVVAEYDRLFGPAIHSGMPMGGPPSSFMVLVESLRGAVAAYESAAAFESVEATLRAKYERGTA